MRPCRTFVPRPMTGSRAAALSACVSFASALVSGLASMNFALRVADFGQLSTLLARLAAVPNVIEARRQA